MATRERRSRQTIAALDGSFREQNDGYVCRECGKVLASKSGFRRHEMNHEGKKPHKCEICSASFMEKEHLQGHLAKHGGSRQRCPKCDSHKSSLKRHIQNCRPKNKSLRFKCDICRQEFERKDCLVDHISGLHTKNYKYLCKEPFCGKSYKWRGSLQKHRLAKHSN